MIPEYYHKSINGLDVKRHKVAEEFWQNYSPYNSGDIPDESEIISTEDWEIKDHIYTRKFFRTADIDGDSPLCLILVIKFEPDSENIVNHYVSHQVRSIE